MYRAKEEGIDDGYVRDAGAKDGISFRAFCEQVLRPMVAG